MNKFKPHRILYYAKHNMKIILPLTKSAAPCSIATKQKQKMNKFKPHGILNNKTQYEINLPLPRNTVKQRTQN